MEQSCEVQRLEAKSSKWRHLLAKLLALHLRGWMNPERMNRIRVGFFCFSSQGFSIKSSIQNLLCNKSALWNGITMNANMKSVSLIYTRASLRQYCFKMLTKRNGRSCKPHLNSNTNSVHVALKIGFWRCINSKTNLCMLVQELVVLCLSFYTH